MHLVPALSKIHPDESSLNIPYVLEINTEDTISVQILELYQELLPSKESHHRRAYFVNKMEALLNEEWPNHDIKVNVFGSSVNDLGTSSSDIDLCLTTPWTELHNVRVLAKLFRKCGMQHIVCVPHAKVPIVRLFDPETRLSCDINVNNTLALLNTRMIKVYVAIDPRVRPLIMIVKYWAKQRLLNDAANGGTLSSYTWTCIVINFLQQREPPILPVLQTINKKDKGDYYFYDDTEKLRGFGAENHESLGGLLFAFCRRYAIEFNYDDQVVSVRQGRYLSKVEKDWNSGRNKISLCVEEPYNVSRNLGNTADAKSVRGIRSELQRFLDMLIAGESLDVICKPYKPRSYTIAHNKSYVPLSQYSQLASYTLDRRKSVGNTLDYHHQYPYSPFHKSHQSSKAYSHYNSLPQSLEACIITKRNSGNSDHTPRPTSNLHGDGDQSVIDTILVKYYKKESSKQIQKRLSHSSTSNKKTTNRKKSLSGKEHSSTENCINTTPTTETRQCVYRRYSIKTEKNSILAKIITVKLPSVSKPPSTASPVVVSNNKSKNKKQKGRPSHNNNKQRRKRKTFNA